MVATELKPATHAEGQEVADVVPLLRVQASLFSRLEGFARRQRTLVSHEDSRPLLALLAERQKLSLELARVSERLRPVRENWDCFRETLTESQREEAGELLKEIRGSLSRVIASDEEDARCLGVRKQMVQESLRNSQIKSATVGVYRNTASCSGRRFDEAT